MNAITSTEHQSALRRAVIRVIPEYFALPPAEQERYRLNIPEDQEFRTRQALLKTLFDIDVADEDAMEDCLRDFDDKQYLLLNSTLLPLQGIGEIVGKTRVFPLSFPFALSPCCMILLIRE